MRDGYRASLSFGRWRRHEERIVHDAVLVWEGAASAVAPGSQAIARAWVLLPEEMPRFDPGRVLTLAEGERLIARAEVLDVLVDEADSPLADLRAAKTRPLGTAR